MDEDAPPVSWVVVGSAFQPMDAHLLQMELDAHGIESMQDGEFTVAIDPILSHAIGGIRIKVEASDAEQAREVLEAFYRRRKEDIESLERTCPDCGAPDGDVIRKPFWFLLPPWPKFECRSCGCRWR